MKRMWSQLYKHVGIVIFTMPFALQAAADVSIKNVKLQNCSAKIDQCISIKSPNVQVSSLRPIYFFNKVELEIGNKKGILSETIERPQGYLDFDSNQLVLQRTDEKGTLTEEVYNLTTLQKKIYITR
jgi:hypothetical protein